MFVVVYDFPIEQLALLLLVGNEYALKIPFWSVLELVASLFQEGEKSFGWVNLLKC